MDFWTAIVIIVAIGVVSEMYGMRLKTAAKKAGHQEAIEALTDRITRLESRMANIESLVIEQEKYKAFDELATRQ